MTSQCSNPFLESTFRQKRNTEGEWNIFTIISFSLSSVLKPAQVNSIRDKGPQWEKLTGKQSFPRDWFLTPHHGCISQKGNLSQSWLIINNHVKTNLSFPLRGNDKNESTNYSTCPKVRLVHQLFFWQDFLGLWAIQHWHTAGSVCYSHHTSASSHCRCERKELELQEDMFMQPF